MHGDAGPPTWEARLLVIRLQRALSRRFRSRVFSSLCLFFFPSIVVAVYLQITLGYPVLGRAVLIGLLWLGIAPWLIDDAMRLTTRFLYSYKGSFRDEREWERLLEKELLRFESPTYFFFGVPWATAVTAVILLVLYPEAPFVIKAWASISFFLLILLSAIGFRGVFVLVATVRDLCASNIQFKPHHPDQFGGLAGVGSYAVRGALYFSSGALVFPVVFEILTELGAGDGLLELGVYGLTAVFVSVMAAAFLLPVFTIKEYVDAQKSKVITESREKLERLLTEFEQCDEFDPKTAIQIGLHYYFEHNKLTQIKNYPYDVRVVFEFGIALLLPVGIAVLELFLS